MSSLYVIVSSDNATIHSQVTHILSSLKIKDLEKISYDLVETPIEQVIENLDTYNFLSKTKVIIGYHANFLSSEKEKGEVEHNLKAFEKYISNPNPENILILITHSLDKRKKVVTMLIERATVIEKEISLNDLLKKELAGYKIEKNTIEFLTQYCGNDNGRILKEIQKLKIYKWTEKEIAVLDVKEVVVRNMEDNIFSLVDSILKRNKKESFSMYHDLLLKGEQESAIVSKLANKIRLIYQVKILINEVKTDQEIGKLLGIHPYPVKLARETSYLYSEDILLFYLSKLAEVDLQMKQGNTTAGLSFEVFMASI